MHSRRAFAFADELRYVTVVHVYQQTYTYLHAIKSSVKKEREREKKSNGKSCKREVHFAKMFRLKS